MRLASGCFFELLHALEIHPPTLAVSGRADFALRYHSSVISTYFDSNARFAFVVLSRNYFFAFSLNFSLKCRLRLNVL